MIRKETRLTDSTLKKVSEILNIPPNDIEGLDPLYLISQLKLYDRRLAKITTVATGEKLFYLLETRRKIPRLVSNLENRIPSGRPSIGHTTSEFSRRHAH